MASEKSEGMEVKGYEVDWPRPTLEHELRGAEWGLAGSPDAPPHHPLVRQSDALALAERAREEQKRERDRLWCNAILATQRSEGERMVADVEALLRHFNEHRPDSGEIHFGESAITSPPPEGEPPPQGEVVGRLDFDPGKLEPEEGAR